MVILSIINLANNPNDYYPFWNISTKTQDCGLVIYSNHSNIIVYNINNQQGDVNIYNVVGQFITSQKLEDGLNNITLDNANGYYIVNVRTSENVVNKKVYIK
ncbi:MAG: T9SS type A sorting domain-containing protein [Bacteroidales bacterium]